jgi:hypothetical protein
MKKFLGIGFEFSAFDKGLNKFFEKTNNDTEKLKDGLDDASGIKPKPGSIWTAISEISKLGLLKSMNDKLGEMQGVTQGIVGKGLSQEWKDVNSLANSMQYKLGGMAKSSEVVNKSLDQVVDASKVTHKEGLAIVGTFLENNMNLEKSADLLKLTGQLTKAFNLNASDVAGTFAYGTKQIGLSSAQMKELYAQSTLLQTKTGLGKNEIIGSLDSTLKSVQERVAQGLISPGQAKSEIMNITKLVTAFRATGMSIGDAQGMITKLTDSSKTMSDSFSQILTGEGGDALAEQVKSWSKMGINIQDVVQKLNTGKVTDAMSLLTEATGKMRAKGGADLKAFSYLMRKTVGEDTMNLMAAAASKGFGEIQGSIREVDKVMASGKGVDVMNEQLKGMSNSIEDQEGYLKTLQERFEKVTSKALEPTAMAYLQFKIKAMDSLTAINEETGKFKDDSWTSGILRGLKKFEQGGLLPFAKDMGIGTDGVMQMTAAFEVLGPMIKGGLDEVFFFTGALSNLKNIFPGLGSSIKNAAVAVWQFGKNAVVTAVKGLGMLFTSTGRATIATNLQTVATNVANVAQKAFAIGIKGVGIALKIAMGPVGWVIGGLTLLAAGAMYAYENFEPFRKVVDQVIDYLGELWDKIKSITFDDLVKGVKKVMKFFYDWMTPFGLITKAFQGLKTLFPDVFSKVESFLKPVIDLFESLGKTIGAVYDKVKNFATGAVGKMWDKVSGMFVSKKEVESEGVSTAAPGTTPGGTTTVEAGTKTVSSATPEAQAGLANATARPGQALEQSAPPSPPKPTQIAAVEKAKGETESMKNTDMKQLATIMLTVGQEIISAILESKNTNVQLKGDANKFFKASSKEQSNKMVSSGITG